MKIVFMGTPDFAVETLNEIVNAGHEVALVVTQPDKPKGRGNKMQFPPVKERALELGLTVEQPLKVREESFVQKLEEIAPDIIVVVAFGQLLTENILNLPKYGLCTKVEATEDFFTGYIFDIPKSNAGGAPQDFGHIFPVRVLKTINKSDITDANLLRSINNCHQRFWSLNPYRNTIYSL